MAKKFEIRNSTAEFLTFVAEGKEQGIQVLYKDETVWATQKAMAVLFDCSADNIGLHLKNIYDTNELNKKATAEKISVVQQEGVREVRRNTLFYNLDAIISVGYRVNSIRATQFRQWCTYVIRQFSLRGYIIDKKRMENGSFIGEDYFEHLLAEIREIRLSERRFYQKLTDIYATAVDYNKDAPTTRLHVRKYVFFISDWEWDKFLSHKKKRLRIRNKQNVASCCDLHNHPKNSFGCKGTIFNRG